MTTKRYTLEQARAAAVLVGLTEQQAEIWFYHYAAQGFLFGSGLPIADLKAALVRWRNNQYKFDKPKAGKQKLWPITGKVCSKKDCKLPAVYKDTSGSYDSYACTKHLPDKVKELFE